MAIEQYLAAPQPGCRFLSEGRAVEPGLKFPEVYVFLFELGIGELVDGDLLGDFRFEIRTASEELAVLLVAVSLEVGNDLFLLRPIKRDRLQV